ncbi:serine hydrolase domain-containing protein [Parahaliea mediterranea]|uniref:Serine hydrolase n=1 Tax=Parahaliea mediterranea TaxID=651086 RepID=A0A939DG18_9GAMM|nr:serine hydrolase [Parahaliea mediterranea]MBN7796867.1 serine hydrolase [Parahaliea mediterranea]
MSDTTAPPRETVGSVRDAYAGRLFPGAQIPTFRNIDRLFPSRPIRRGDTVRPLVVGTGRAFKDMTFESAGQRYDLFDWVSRNRIAGVLVMKDGQRRFEHYEFGNTANTRWMSMSMAKSISTTLVGVAIQQGLIASVDDALVQYIPSLAGGAYEDVTVRHLMLMASGVQWNEDSTDESSERRQVLELQIAQRPGAILDYMSGLPKLAPSGTRWNYSTGETHLVGELLKAATGQWPADFLSEHLWSRLGMESDASWWLESPDGLEIAGSGIAATLRDYGRFGQFICDGGVIDGRPVLPPGWVAEAAGPTDIHGETVPYGYMWWSVAGGDGRYDDGAFSARGIFGQRIFINPARNVVIVVWSARSKPLGDEPICDNDFCNAACEWLA